LTPLATAALTVFILVLMIGLFITVFGLPGSLLIFLAALFYAVATGFSPLGFQTILALLLLAFFAEGLEFLLGMWGAHHAAASRRGLAAAGVGGVVGMMVLTPWLYGPGALIGLFAGAFTGVWITEMIRQWNLKSAFRAEPRAILGWTAGSLVRGALTVGMTVVILITIYS
jgi:hypothetical protein